MTLRDRPVILHVLESYGAGSARAAEGYAAALPEYSHVVLRHLRDGESVSGQEHAAFDDVFDLPSSPVAAVRAVRRVVRQVRPSRVHAHSSYAGAFVRLALPRNVARRAVVYTPHCFAFERQDLRTPVRAVVRAAERLLAPRTSVIAACSPDELRLASGLRARRPPVLVPNVAPHPGVVAAPSMDLVGVGRLGPQKDPELFARIAATARSSGVITTARWIGDGADRAMMERFGIEVTGWRAPEEVAAISAASGVYVHTARWEGFPLSILEAHRTGLPVVARRIAAMEGMPPEWLFDDVEGALELIRSVADPHARASNLAAWEAALAGNTIEEQRRSLLLAYGFTPVSP